MSALLPVCRRDKSMKTMKAALYSGVEQISIQEVEWQSPPPGYIVLEMRQIGVCGSDLHAYFGHWTQSPGRAQGHETCGVVVEIGEGVTGFASGDLVAVECFSHCGQCIYCQTGQYNHCAERKGISDMMHGGFAEYTTVHHSGLFKLPTGMTPEEGALVEPLAVAVRALAQARVSYQDRVAVIGGGTIGLLCLAVAKACGVKEAMISVKYPQQARIAHELGADQVIDINQVDIRDFVSQHTSGMGVDAIIETVGSAQNFDDSLAIVRKRGTVVLVAGYYKPLEVSLGAIVSSEAIVTGSNCYGYSDMHKDFEVAIDLIATGKVAATKIVTHRFPLDEITKAFAVAADKGSGAIKVHVLNL
jgi:2-desacetyl-2-hydroxyethyl bacteriochlorophyllide A dehydrogenase